VRASEQVQRGSCHLNGYLTDEVRMVSLEISTKTEVSYHEARLGEDWEWGEHFQRPLPQD